MSQVQKNKEMIKLEKQHSFGQMFLASGSAGMIAEVATLPIDTVKVRMQVFQNKYKNLFDCGKQLLKQEGFASFYQGCFPGLLRQIFFASTRISLFDYSIHKLQRKKGKDNINVLDRIGLGIVTGAIAISIANPFDVMKVRFQSDMKQPGAKKRYNGVLHAFRTIYAKEGIIAFYQSLPPNILRNSIINAAELATYSQFKSFFLRNKIFKNEGFSLYFSCSFLAGFCAVLVGSPFDVVKSRMMDGHMVDGKKVMYKSIGEAVGSLYKQRGFKGFYAGFNANFSRIVSWNIVMFLSKEYILQAMPKKQLQQNLYYILYHQSNQSQIT